MKRLSVLVAVLVLLGAGMLWSQQQIEDTKLPVNSAAIGYWNITANGYAGGWTLDTAQVDTTVAYKIVPGVRIRCGAILDAAADSLDKLYIQGSIDGARWAIIDSIPSDGGNVEGTNFKMTAVTSGNPVVYRWIRFIADNDGADATSGTTITGYVLTSAWPE